MYTFTFYITHITYYKNIFSCKETDLGGFPIWIIILGFVSHIFLVLNSMANFLIYCLVGTKFRKAFVKVFVLIVNTNKYVDVNC